MNDTETSSVMATDSSVCDTALGLWRAGSLIGGIHFSGCTALAPFVGEHSPISLCRSNMPAPYVKQRCDPDRPSFFFPTLALSKRILSDVAEPFGPERCKYTCE